MNGKYIDPFNLFIKIWLGIILLAGVYRFILADEARIISNLVFLESAGRAWVSNVKGKSYGKYMLTQSVLDDYNAMSKSGKFFTVKDLFNTNRAYKVFKWHWERLKRKFNTNWFDVINAYNMGMRNTMEGNYYLWYIRQIIPLEYHYYLRQYKIIRRKKGSKIFILKRKEE